MIEIKGTISAIVTPMHSDESINEDELRRQVDRQIEAGADGVFALGTNGEAYILSSEEKERVISVVVEHAAGRVPVYAGTGCIGTADTIALSRRAQALGVDAISVITPSFSVASQEELYQHYASVANAVDLPVVLYNIPARTGNALHWGTVARLSRIGNIQGVKDSSGNFDNILLYLENTDSGSFSVLSGNDSLILWTLLAGGKGGITAVANVFPRTMAGIYREYQVGNVQQARFLQDSIRPLRNCLGLGNPNTVIKYATTCAGQDVGSCRRPFHLLSEEAKQKIETVVKEHREPVAD